MSGKAKFWGLVAYLGLSTLATLAIVAAVVSGVEARSRASVCDVFISDQTYKIIFDETELNDLQISMRLRRDKLVHRVYFFAGGDPTSVGQDRFMVPSQGVSTSDFLVHVSEEILASNQGGVGRNLWKTTVWTAAPGSSSAAPKFLKKATWETEIDANQYSQSSAYRESRALTWLNTFPLCK